MLVTTANGMVSPPLHPENHSTRSSTDRYIIPGATGDVKFVKRNTGLTTSKNKSPRRSDGGLTVHTSKADVVRGKVDSYVFVRESQEHASDGRCNLRRMAPSHGKPTVNEYPAVRSERLMPRSSKRKWDKVKIRLDIKTNGAASSENRVPSGAPRRTVSEP